MVITHGIIKTMTVIALFSFNYLLFCDSFGHCSASSVTCSATEKLFLFP
jgi:hypothetical protein